MMVIDASENWERWKKEPNPKYQAQLHHLSKIGGILTP